MSSRNTMLVRVPKDLWNNAETWAKKSWNVSVIKKSDVFKFMYNNTLMGDIGHNRFPPMRKKGSWLDVGYFVILIAVFAMLILVGVVVSNAINTQFQATSQLPAESKTISQKITDKFSTTTNNMYLIFVIGLVVVSLALAALVRVHPVFIPIFFISLVFLVWVAGALSDAYQSMASNPMMASSAAKLTSISLVMNWLPLFTTVCGIAIMVVMYKTWRG